MTQKKFTPAERRAYVLDKLQQIGETANELAKICFIELDEVNKLLSGERNIEDKDWVQIGLGLSRLAKKKGIPTEKEEKKSGLISAKKISRTSIIKKVEALDIFNEKSPTTD